MTRHEPLELRPARRCEDIFEKTCSNNVLPLCENKRNHNMCTTILRMQRNRRK